MTHSSLTTGRLLRRPRASATPMGKDSTMPETERIRLSINPPQSLGDTGSMTPGSPNQQEKGQRVCHQAAHDEPTRSSHLSG